MMRPHFHLTIPLVPPSGMSTDPAPPSKSPLPREAPVSLATLFEEEEGPLLRFAMGLTRIRAVAEEVVQEGFLRLHQHWNEVGNPRAWLYRCVRNLALNHHRDHMREEGQPEPPDCGDPGPLPDELAGRMEACGQLRLLVAELSAEDRALVELKYQQQLPYAEIGRRTGLGTGNVGYRLHHILKGLAESLRNVGIESSRG